MSTIMQGARQRPRQEQWSNTAAPRHVSAIATPALHAALWVSLQPTVVPPIPPTVIPAQVAGESTARGVGVSAPWSFEESASTAASPRLGSAINAALRGWTFGPQDVRPNEAALALARSAAAAFAPELVTFDGDGAVVLERWCAERKITVYVESEERLHYVQSWGPDPEAQMTDGTSDIAGLHGLVGWLLTGVGAHQAS